MVVCGAILFPGLVAKQNIAHYIAEQGGNSFVSKYYIFREFSSRKFK